MAPEMESLSLQLLAKIRGGTGHRQAENFQNDVLLCGAHREDILDTLVMMKRTYP